MADNKPKQGNDKEKFTKNVDSSTKRTTKKTPKKPTGETDSKAKKSPKKSVEDKAGEFINDTKKAAQNISDEAKKGAQKVKESAKEFAKDLDESTQEFQEKAKSTAHEFTKGAKEAYDQITENKENKKLLAGILAILFGALGIHKFILGYTKEGIIMLVISIISFGLAAWIVGIIGLIEGIIYLTKTDEEFYRIYQVNKRPWF